MHLILFALWTALAACLCWAIYDAGFVRGRAAARREMHQAAIEEEAREWARRRNAAGCTLRIPSSQPAICNLQSETPTDTDFWRDAPEFRPTPDS